MASPAPFDHQTLLEATWAAFRAQVAAGNQHLVLPDNLPSSVVTTIATRYSDLIDGPVSTIAVPSLQIIRFTPFAGTPSSAASPSIASPASVAMSAPEPKGKAKVPRPPNAFILYRQAYHPIIKQDFPGIANNDISKKVAALWKAEAGDVKDAWKAKAQEVKLEHAKLYPNYSYQPRKPSEKKRRMTKRKAAALQADAGVVQQLPLPSFELATNNPAMMEFPVVDAPTTIETFGQMIDQHNDSQLVFDHNTPSAAVSTAGFEFGGTYFPMGDMGDMGGYPSSFTVENANIDDPFGSDNVDPTAEQQRQQALSEEVFDWSLFTGDYDAAA